VTAPGPHGVTDDDAQLAALGYTGDLVHGGVDLADTGALPAATLEVPGVPWRLHPVRERLLPPQR
jgi:hypothetical protein